ncbi:hypothetical protein [Skermania piniformis]|uniref:Uncharacterized protein n=1 Tax=Skermania pinensis TaxID=39122 RepID=A0ABX8SE05_9ACTN|nr:hypothetical protein [Skermania piniformis]QXQ14855.1 hypothetical protein KV203_05590 [Skermania piniformis]
MTTSYPRGTTARPAAFLALLVAATVVFHLLGRHDAALVAAFWTAAWGYITWAMWREDQR